MPSNNQKKKNFLSMLTKSVVMLLVVAIFATPFAGFVSQARAQSANIDNTSTFTSSSVGNGTGGTVTPGGATIDNSTSFTSGSTNPTATTPGATSATTPPPIDQNQNTGNVNLTCEWTSGTNWSICFSNIIYVFTVGLMSIFAYIGAYIFDIGVQLTLNSTTFSQEFLTTTWTTVRDFANMAFIFMLVYIAIMIIFKADSTGTRRTLAGVIIVALLINFSFLFTRLVIDAGNILAIQFYNGINAPPLAVTAQTSNVSSVASSLPGNNGSVKDLTAGIMQLIGVQTLLGSQSFQTFFTKQGTGAGAFGTNLLVLSFIYIAVGIILAILAFVFTIVGIKFLIRIVMLWIAIIASPLALVAGALSPISKPVGDLFGQWRSTLVEYSFYPAVFLFMFWIVNTFAAALGTNGSTLNSAFQTTGLSNTANSGSYLITLGVVVSSIAIRLALLVILLMVAMKASDKIASTGSTWARSATGWAGGKLSGATAWGGRNTVGRAAYRFSQSATGKKLASSNIFGRALYKGTDRIGRAGFDARGLPGLTKTVDRVTGVKLGSATSNNFESAEKKRVASRVALANKLGPNERQLEKTTRTAVANADRTQLDQLYGEYLYADQQFRDSNPLFTEQEVSRAQKKYEAELKKVSGTINKAAGAAAGAGNKTTFANNLETRRFGNLYGVLSSGIPRMISATDKDAAAQIRGKSQNNAGSILREAIEGGNIAPRAFIPPVNSPQQNQQGGNQGGGAGNNQQGGPVLNPPPLATPPPPAGGGGATTGARGGGSGTGGPRRGPSGPTPAPEGLRGSGGADTSFVQIDALREPARGQAHTNSSPNTDALEKSMLKSAQEANEANMGTRQLMREQLKATTEVGSKVSMEVKEGTRKTNESLAKVSEAIRAGREHVSTSALETSEHIGGQIRNIIEETHTTPSPTAQSTLPTSTPMTVVPPPNKTTQLTPEKKTAMINEINLRRQAGDFRVYPEEKGVVDEYIQKRSTQNQTRWERDNPPPANK